MGNSRDVVSIGVFYDGNYLLHVSNYYYFKHSRKSRINVAGIHNFIKHQTAEELGVNINLCKIVDAHYFRGRQFILNSSGGSNSLTHDRIYEDFLMYEGITTHFLPVKNFSGEYYEKGVDVWLALEAYEAALHKKLDVIALISSDGDYVPLIKKINSLGTKVMLLYWDFQYRNDFGTDVVTRTSQDLIEEVSFPIAMQEVIDNRSRKNESLINNIFASKDERRSVSAEQKVEAVVNSDEDKEVREGVIQSVKDGYGFIIAEPKNIFFHYNSVQHVDFATLKEGDKVEYYIQRNDRNEPVGVITDIVE